MGTGEEWTRFATCVPPRGTARLAAVQESIGSIRRTTLPTRNHLYLLSVVLLLEVVNRLAPRQSIDAIARALGGLAYRLSRGKRARMERHVSQVFGASLGPVERARIVRGAFQTFWDDVFSLVPWRAGRASIPDVSGLEHVRAALDAGKGAVLWESGYFGQRNIAKQVLQQHGFHIHQVHDESHFAGFARDDDPGWVRDQIVVRYFARCERAFTASIIALPRSGSLASTRELLAKVRRNEILCITADEPNGHRLVSLRILGATKRFATGMVTLSRASGAPLLPLFCIRDGDGRIRVIVEPPVPIPSAGGRDAVVETPLRHYATLLESYIQRYPEQYRSWHYPWWMPA